MNENEIQLKVQALVDAELTGREAEDLRARIETDDGLRELHERITVVRGLMAGAELPRTLPESGDFHWSKIAQGIEHGERDAGHPAKPAPGVNRWLRWVMPLAGAACLVLLLTLQLNAPPDLGILLGGDHELELTDDEIDIMTFNTADDAMSIVWLDHSIDLHQNRLKLWLD